MKKDTMTLRWKERLKRIGGKNEIKVERSREIEKISFFYKEKKKGGGDRPIL